MGAPPAKEAADRSGARGKDKAQEVKKRANEAKAARGPERAEKGKSRAAEAKAERGPDRAEKGKGKAKADDDGPRLGAEAPEASKRAAGPEARAARADASRRRAEAERVEAKRALGPLAERGAMTPDVRAEQKRHAKRVAKLTRVRELAAAKGNKKALARVEKLEAKEADRHQAWIAKKQEELR